MTVTDWDSAVGALRAVVVRVESDLPPGDVQSVWELIDAGELGVAFENLCTQIYEYEVAVDQATRSSLTAIGEYLGLDKRLWEVLKRAT
jgi:hypothetical protein